MYELNVESPLKERSRANVVSLIVKRLVCTNTPLTQDNQERRVRTNQCGITFEGK